MFRQGQFLLEENCGANRSEWPGLTCSAFVSCVSQAGRGPQQERTAKKKSRSHTTPCRGQKGKANTQPLLMPKIATASTAARRARTLVPRFAASSNHLNRLARLAGRPAAWRGKCGHQASTQTTSRTCTRPARPVSSTPQTHATEGQGEGRTRAEEWKRRGSEEGDRRSQEGAAVHSTVWMCPVVACQALPGPHTLRRGRRGEGRREGEAAFHCFLGQDPRWRWRGTHDRNSRM